MNKMNTRNTSTVQYDFVVLSINSTDLHVVFPFIVNFALINSTRARLRYKKHLTPKQIRQGVSVVHFIH